MQVKSIAEYSKGSILLYFRLSLSYHLLLRFFCLSNFEWPFHTGSTVYKNIYRENVVWASLVFMVCLKPGTIQF